MIERRPGRSSEFDLLLFWNFGIICWHGLGIHPPHLPWMAVVLKIATKEIKL
jgi:hypothetical protein